VLEATTTAAPDIGEPAKLGVPMSSQHRRFADRLPPLLVAARPVAVLRAVDAEPSGPLPDQDCLGVDIPPPVLPVFPIPTATELKSTLTTTERLGADQAAMVRRRRSIESGAGDSDRAGSPCRIAEVEASDRHSSSAARSISGA
jgi:hypothetical protein